MKRICLLDPSLEDNHGTASSNLGDLIIREAVMQELHDLFPSCDVIRVSTQARIGLRQAAGIRLSKYRFVGGSNLLSSRMDEYHQWRISRLDIPVLGDVVLMGVGWWQYQEKPNSYTRQLLRHVLSGKYLHAVRDRYTLEMLAAIGIENVCNTGCPTMWRLPATPPAPAAKAENVLTMLTDYHSQPEPDSRLLRLLQSHYRTLYFWPQGRRDAEYAKSLGFPLHMLGHSVDSLDSFLAGDISCDCIGTRLHGGIRCLSRGKRALILAVDNRAREISSDSGLPVVERTDIDSIRRWILEPSPAVLRLHGDAISRWKAQFA